MPENHEDKPARPVFRTRKASAKYLTEKFGAPISDGTLSKWAVDGTGPPFRNIGRNAIYEETDLDAFGLSRMPPKIWSTSETGKPKRSRPVRKIVAPVEPQRIAAPVESAGIGQSARKRAKLKEPAE